MGHWLALVSPVSSDQVPSGQGKVVLPQTEVGWNLPAGANSQKRAQRQSSPDCFMYPGPHALSGLVQYTCGVRSSSSSSNSSSSSAAHCLPALNLNPCTLL